jgi:hypothetical protein
VRARSPVVRLSRAIASKMAANRGNSASLMVKPAA